MQKEVFYYHIEDGQFSFDFDLDKLVGKEGDIVKMHTERMGNEIEDEFKIISIKDNYVECLGFTAIKS